MFESGEYDEEFHALDGEIDRFAKGLDGFQKVSTWKSPDHKYTNASYFFADMDSVRKLASFPLHMEAKEKFARWYKSYEVTIMEVISTYSGSAAGDARPPLSG